MDRRSFIVVAGGSATAFFLPLASDDKNAGVSGARTELVSGSFVPDGSGLGAPGIREHGENSYGTQAL